MYVQLSANATEASVNRQLLNVGKKYNAFEVDFLKKKGYKADANGDYAGFKLLPINDLHFNAELGTGNAVSRPFLYILLLVALVIILIACFNFINLNIGLSFTRTKEIGIRKCLGAGKKQVWLQVWGESFATVLIAMVISIIATVVLMNGFNKMMESKFDTSLLYQPLIVLSLIFLLFSVSFIAAGYPSYIMGKLKTVEILKGKFALKKTRVISQFINCYSICNCYCFNMHHCYYLPTISAFAKSATWLHYLIFNKRSN